MSDDNDPPGPLFSCDGKPCPAVHPVTTSREALRVSVAGIASRIHTKEAVVTYLIVALDLKTHAPWHENVSADDVGTAKRIARTRAAAQGIDLVVAAVIGPNSAVVSEPAEKRAAGLKAA